MPPPGVRSLMEISEAWQTAEKRYVVFEEENQSKGDRIYRKDVIPTQFFSSVIFKDNAIR